MSRFRLVLNYYMQSNPLNPMMNVFYYESTAGGSSASALGGAFDTVVLPDIANIQSNTVIYDGITVQDLDDPANFAVLNPTTNQGTGGGGVDVLPPFMAWSFQYFRATTASRHGWKRFAGLEEGMITGSLPTAAMLTLIQTLEVTLRSHLPAFPVGWDPRIGRRPPVGGTIDQTILFPVADVQYRNITTQNTRKG